MTKTKTMEEGIKEWKDTEVWAFRSEVLFSEQRIGRLAKFLREQGYIHKDEINGLIETANREHYDKVIELNRESVAKLNGKERG